MFGKTYNNTDTVSVNNRITTLFSDTAYLSLAFWNTNLSLTMAPSDGKTNEGRTKYSKDVKVSTSIVIDKVYMLLNAINEDILPVIQEYRKTGKFEQRISRGIEVGKNKDTGIFIEWDQVDGDDAPSVALSVYVAIDPKSFRPTGNIVSYKFNKQIIIKDYDVSQGVAEGTPEEAEFYMFVKMLESHIMTLGVVPHSIEYASKNKFIPNGGAGARKDYSNDNSSYSAPSGDFADSDDLPF